MTFNALIVVAGLTVVLFFIAAVRNLSGRRIAGGLLKGSISVVLFPLAVCAALASANLRTYQRLARSSPPTPPIGWIESADGTRASTMNGPCRAPSIP